MLFTNSFIRRLGWFGVLVAYCLCVPMRGYACSPALPDPWFTEHITIVPATLPAGVGVRVFQKTCGGIPRDVGEIINTSPHILYVIGKPWTSKNIFDPVSVTLPSGVGPTHKLVNQQAFTWRPIFDTPQSHARMEWTQEMSERKDAVLLEVHHNMLQSDEADVINLLPHNHTGDNRPLDVRLPEEQAVVFPLIYGTHLIQIPIIVSYGLNPSYKPFSVAQSLNACTSSAVSTLGICLIVFVVGVAGTAWVSYRRRNMQKSTTSL